MASLLNNASLLLNPAGSVISYKEDKIYSVIPRNGAGDFTFSGGDGGTRVNQQGYIEQTPFNLFQYSNAFNTSPWSMAVTGGQTGKDGAANAWLLTKAGATTSDLYNALTTDGVQTFSIYVKKESSKGIKIYNFGTVNNFVTINIQTGVNLAQSGAGVISYKAVEYNASWWRVQVTMNCTNGKWYIYVTDGAGTQIQSSITIQDAQLVVGSDPKPYQPTTDRLNYPRITYQNGRGALLSEPQRTNIVLNSTVGNYGNAPGSSTTTISPDGTNNATVPVPDASADRYQETISGGVYATGTKLTYSWHYKQLASHAGSNPNEPGGLYVTGLVNCDLIGSVTKMYDLANGWSRWQATFNVADGSLQTIIRLYFGFVIGIGFASSAYYGHQLEVGSFATSYIPTTSATVTRPADVSGASISSIINSSEGTLYTDMVINGTLVSDQFYLSLHAGSSANSIYIGQYNTAGLFRIVNGGSLTVNINPTFELNKRYKFALAYKANDVVAYINGVQVGSDTSTAIPSVTSIGINNFNQNGNFEANTSAYFNSRLSATQLAELTTVRSGSGGNISYYGPYTIHTFTGSATFTPSFNGEVEVLVVAGGGGGGSGFFKSACGGGGGAGGLQYVSSYGVSAGTGITVTVGAGGAGGPQGVGSPTGDGTNGSNSVFGEITTVGGGGGTTYFDVNGKNGGSGGGAGGAGGYTPIGGQGITGQGNNGGNQVGSGQSTDTTSCGGGGGASAVGANGVTSQRGGNGGDGLPYSISGFSAYYAGGGGGGASLVGGGYGGLGGGGNGGSIDSDGSDAVDYTGGGGGGASSGPGNASTGGGDGGNGIVIIRYLT